MDAIVFATALDAMNTKMCWLASSLQLMLAVSVSMQLTMIGVHYLSTLSCG